MLEFQTVRDVMNFAISLERVAQDFYHQLAERVTDPAVHHFLLEMVREEAFHEEQLRSLVENNASDLTGNVDQGELRSYIEAMKVPDELDYKKAVKVAYDKEKASEILYLILAKAVTLDHIKQLLEVLARQEKKHKEFFSREYDQIRLSEN